MVNAGYAYRERIGAEAAGRTVVAYLSARYGHSSERQWRERIGRGEVELDLRPAAADDVLCAGQSLVWHRPGWREPAVPLAYAILYRDAELLAVAKPRGLPSVPNGGYLEHTLLYAVRRHFPEAVPMHRLGRGTSGIVLFARTANARREVAAAFRNGRVEKVYRALVTGAVARERFTIDVPIGPVPHPRLGRVYAANASGRAAVSHVARLWPTASGDTVVEVKIPTGRPHQIRIHLAAAGHPLVGDPIYVAGGFPASAPGLPGDGGYRLHACRLALPHPRTGAPVVVDCAPPLELR